MNRRYNLSALAIVFAASASAIGKDAAYASEAEVFPPADLDAFRARGGRIIMYGGLDDTSCPELEIRKYYRDAD